MQRSRKFDLSRKRQDQRVKKDEKGIRSLSHEELVLHMYPCVHKLLEGKSRAMMCLSVEKRRDIEPYVTGSFLCTAWEGILCSHGEVFQRIQ